MIPPRFPAYSRYADIYDSIGQRAFGEGIARATLAWLAERQFRPRTVLDLACGTGAATLVFASRGLNATGVDRSAEMLRHAEDAAAIAQLDIIWVENDIRTFRSDQRFDLVTCFYDAVNYLIEPDDLGRFFRTAFHALETGGYLVFDLNTEHRFMESVGHQIHIAVDRSDLFCIYRTWYIQAERLSPLVVTCFSLVDGAGAEALWQRFDEEHVERAFSIEEVHEELAQAGLEPVGSWDYFERESRIGGQAGPESDRIIVIARKSSIM